MRNAAHPLKGEFRNSDFGFSAHPPKGVLGYCPPSRFHYPKAVISSEAVGRAEKSAGWMGRGSLFVSQACPERAKRVEWIPPLGRYAPSVGMTWRKQRGQERTENRPRRFRGRVGTRRRERNVIVAGDRRPTITRS